MKKFPTPRKKKKFYDVLFFFSVKILYIKKNIVKRKKKSWLYFMWHTEGFEYRENEKTVHEL